MRTVPGTQASSLAESTTCLSIHKPCTVKHLTKSVRSSSAMQTSWSSFGPNRLSKYNPPPVTSHREELRDRLPGFLRSLALSLRHDDSAERARTAFRLLNMASSAGRSAGNWPDLVRDYQILRIVLVDHLTRHVLDQRFERPRGHGDWSAVGRSDCSRRRRCSLRTTNTTISEAEPRIREIMDSVADGIIVVDDHRGIIVMLNPAVGADLRQPRRHTIGTSVSGSDRAVGSLCRGQLLGLARGTPGRGTAAAKSDPRAPRRWRAIDLEIAVSRFKRGNEPLSIALVRDVTEQKRLEEELKGNARELETLNRSLATLTAEAGESNRAKSDFLAKMSHEIRSPMTAILGYVELLGLQLEAPDQLQAIGTIKRNANFLFDIINDVLDLSKIEARKFDVELHLRGPLGDRR